MTTIPSPTAYDEALTELQDWLMPNPFLSAPAGEPPSRFVLDAEAFWAAIDAEAFWAAQVAPPCGKDGSGEESFGEEPPPAFLAAPSAAFLRAIEITPAIEPPGNQPEPAR